jgi:hypothetical protein
MKEIKNGYKIVTKNGDKYMSYHPFVESSVVYEKEKWARPLRKNGPLTVFDSFSRAMIFLNSQTSQDYNRVFVCKYVPSKRKSVWDLEGRASLCRLPKGTILANRVMIISKARKK